MGASSTRVTTRSEGIEVMRKIRWYSGLDGATRVLAAGAIALGALAIVWGGFLIGYGWGMR